MTFLGKVIHYSIDLVLISTAMAGIRQSTGLTPALDNTDNAANKVAKSYLEVGEKVIDIFSSHFSKYPKYFKRE